MIEINFNKVCKNFGFGNVLEDVSFEIKTGEIVALIGQNGAGKSTILNIINKDENVTSGKVTLRNGSKIGYLKQIVSDNKNKTVSDVLNDSIKEVLDMEQELFNLELKMEESKEDINKLVVKYYNLQNKFIELDGYEASKRLGKVIKGFKLEKHLDTLYDNLSGGEKRIVSLAALILTNPDILLLDEPTNHLDIETLEWFEDYLKSIKKTVLIVSHDRYFLDRVVNKIILLEKGCCDIYFGNYSYYMEEHERRIMQEFEAYKNQEKKIEAMKESINKLKEFGRRASPEGGNMFFRRAASIEKRLEKMEKIDKPTKNKDLNLKFDVDKRSGNDVLIIKNEDLSIGDRLLIKNIKMEIFYGDKVAIIGKNGTGKTTLIKHIIEMYQNNTDDRLKIGSNVKIGYIPQEIKFDDENQTIFEYTRKFYDGEDKYLRSSLFNFHFFDDDIFKKISKLSGGEKVRLKLFELIQEKCNFLIFDEPTNHIDIETRTILEDALIDFKGTLLCISHDRYFMNKLISKIYYIDDKKINICTGNYDDFKRFMLK